MVIVNANEPDLGLKDPTLLPRASFIDNAAHTTERSEPLEVLNPSDASLVVTIAQTTPKAVQRAIDSATLAQIEWRDTHIDYRIQLLQKWVQLMREARQDLARVITLENGKPYVQGLGEVDYAAGFFDWNAQHILHASNTSTVDLSATSRSIVTKSAIGVVLAITPWNFPLAMLARKVSAAVAAGRSVIAKPSEFTPLAALMLAELGRRAGAPRGLLNVLVTEQAEQTVDQILSAPSVQMLSFTGSTHIGKIVGKSAAQRVLRVGLELGGHAPFIVFEDADLDKAAAGLLKNKLRNSGQSCVCANRIFVHEDVHDRFTDLLQERLQGVKVGDGFGDVDIGPLIGSKSIQKIRAQLEDAKHGGAKCRIGGTINGNFCEATLLTEVTDDMLIAGEETFGPVIGVLKFSSESEVWDRANKTQAGLAAYLYTRDMGRLMRGLRELQYGMVGLNDVTLSAASTSFGGLRESGLGREGGHDSLEDYLSTKFAVLSF
ncbi:succinic semialdehyde dehydrogenase [Gracilaria domingensis]|nr:succinic semialdehyde dehydrogenase [Gracilaria domingensis]